MSGRVSKVANLSPNRSGVEKVNSNYFSLVVPILLTDNVTRWRGGPQHSGARVESRGPMVHRGSPRPGKKTFQGGRSSETVAEVDDPVKRGGTCQT